MQNTNEAINEAEQTASTATARGHRKSHARCGFPIQTLLSSGRQTHLCRAALSAKRKQSTAWKASGFPVGVTSRWLMVSLLPRFQRVLPHARSKVLHSCSSDCSVGEQALSLILHGSHFSVCRPVQGRSRREFHSGVQGGVANRFTLLTHCEKVIRFVVLVTL